MNDDKALGTDGRGVRPPAAAAHLENERGRTLLAAFALASTLVGLVVAFTANALYL